MPIYTMVDTRIILLCLGSDWYFSIPAEYETDSIGIKRSCRRGSRKYKSTAESRKYKIRKRKKSTAIFCNAL